MEILISSIPSAQLQKRLRRSGRNKGLDPEGMSQISMQAPSLASSALKPRKN
jgi:hypothetical protein